MIRPKLPFPIVGFAGKARTGKDTAAVMVVEMFDAYRYGFADPIKAMTDAMGIERGGDHEKEEILPRFGRSRRYLWQTLGTEWGRNLVHPDIWLICAEQQLEVFGPGMVLSDVRFDNEAKWVRSMGGVIVHMVRDSAEKIHGSDSHQSEMGVTAVTGRDLAIHNNGDLAGLRLALKQLFWN